MPHLIEVHFAIDLACKVLPLQMQVLRYNKCLCAAEHGYQHMLEEANPLPLYRTAVGIPRLEVYVSCS